MPKQGKVWGETTLLNSWGFNEVHFLRIDKGGFCSEHRHTGRTNYFYVISGQLKLSIWGEGQDKGMEDITILEAGQSTIIPLGVWHKFEALKDTLAIESYELKGAFSDIERRSVGGKPE